MAGGRVLVTGSEGFTGQYVCERAGTGRLGGIQSWAYCKARRATLSLRRPARPLVAVANRRPGGGRRHSLGSDGICGRARPCSLLSGQLAGHAASPRNTRSAKHPPACTIIASSANIYGNTTAGAISENVPPNPANDYAVSKLAMEYLVRTYMNRLGIVITRPFNYTGVGQNPRFLIPRL